MSTRKRRQRRVEANRTALESVAAAPSFKAARKKSSAKSGRSPLRRALIVATFATVMVAALIGAPKVSRADFNPVPEIDPGSMAGAMTLLVGGLLALTDRARRS